MTQLQVDQALLQRLGGLDKSVELCGEDGTILGRYLPEAEYRKILYGSIQISYSDKEVARRRAQTGGCSLREIWDRLGRNVMDCDLSS